MTVTWDPAPVLARLAALRERQESWRTREIIEPADALGHARLCDVPAGRSVFGDREKEGVTGGTPPDGPDVGDHGGEDPADVGDHGGEGLTGAGDHGGEDPADVGDHGRGDRADAGGHGRGDLTGTREVPPGLAVALTMRAVLGVLHDHRLDLPFDHNVHAAQSLTWHAPIAVGASIETRAWIGRIKEGARAVFFDVETESFTEDGRMCLRGTSTQALRHG
ncbi:hypothetical protein ABT352_15275 [Streptosporangium sp. NPDC000563]|uniref:FAS1-like dehydratase domain-containing protein n=1 Tax=Streptosporangium sp. NPDC000563 TaxID=3154366 RepID=UPI00332104C5